MENLSSAEEESKVEDAVVDEEDETWMKQFETKTSFVLRDSKDVAYNFSLESVLQHHQEAISSVCWIVPNAVKVAGRPLTIADLRLLSSSFDFNVSMWEADTGTEAWSVESNLGAMVGNKHAFFGAMFLNDDINQILAYTYGGAMHQWKRDAETDQWKSQLTVKGHFGEVSDLAWDEHEYSLISTSQD